MPLNVPAEPIKFPPPSFLTLGNFKRGVITLIDKSRLPKDALEEADNIFLVEDGQPSPRPGVDWYGTSPLRGISPSASASPSASTSLSRSPSASSSLSVSPSASQSRSPSSSVSPSASASRSPSSSVSPSASVSPSSSASSSVSSSRSPSSSSSASQSPSGSVSPSASASGSPSGSPSPSASVSPSASASHSMPPDAVIDGFDYFDFNGVSHLIVAAGGTIYRSTDDAQTWSACTGAYLHGGNTVYMNQYNSKLYITNGVDPITLYDGSTVLTQYATLATPAAPTLHSGGKVGLGGTSISYFYKIAAVNTIGFSAASLKYTQTVDRTRDRWDASNNITLDMPSYQSGQTRFDVYLSDDDISYYYLDSVTTPATTWLDDGSAVVIPSTTAPVADNSAGPLVAELTNVGSRMYGIRDTNNKHRIWFTSGTPPVGAFSNAYDGGYLDWDTGGKYTPIKVEDYRDGKGTPLATIFCKSADGQGCILQMSLDTFTVGDISITVPSAYKLPGSRGTPAPGSVINVLNDYMFYNSQAFYNLGSRPQLLQILSTDEFSANIRPTVRQISGSGEGNIASVYFDAKVYFSVPYGSSSNNYTAVYDTERKAWLPKAFTMGFSKFLRYTDASGNRRLLCLKPGDGQLSEISSNIQGDYGLPFSTSLLTGLYPTVQDRFDFQFVEEAEVEFSNPQGDISVELIGIERSHGFATQKSETVTSQTTATGHSTFLHSTTAHSVTATAIDTFSESSVKRYFTVQKELNAVQWRVTTNSLNARYVLRTLQTWGTPTLAGKPASWRLT